MQADRKTIRFLPLPRQRTISTPSRMLKEHLKAARDGEELAYYLHTRPMMRTIVLRLARYLTAVIPGENSEEQTLFDDCLALGTREWRFAVKQGREPACQTAYFMRGLIAFLPTLQRLTIVGYRGGEKVLWNPLEVPLLRWSRSLEGFPMVFNDPPEGYWTEFRPVEFRMIVMTRFLCHEPRFERLVASNTDFITGL